ncbi:ectomycorrhiza-regulated esterase [Thelephora ganbajun]|uniref:Ectomycorrhiza-regulated esterase n=1 Tax=Thelephora ganbajun TaxID=370292 RepID=A0ACB6ZFD6_THEGA|nr:ectomycorrhiza-regulated esterase [Thelephora ganbajun]
MSGDRKSSKIYIPHTKDEGCNIVGILEQLDPDGDTRGRPIALLLHGSLGHKDYIYQKRLGQQLPIDSFRFDFRGGHETPGEFAHGNFNSDIVDVDVVVKHLKSKYGYVVTTIVSHSKASKVAMRYLCTHEEDAADVRCYVNVAGRYRMRVNHEKLYPGLDKSFETLGYHELQATIAGEPRTLRIYPHHVEEFCSWDTSIVWDKFPHHIHVLTIHGIMDTRIPVYDAVLYSRALGNRSPGTHNLCLIEDADHNFTRPGNRETIIETILKWYDVVYKGECKTGIWETGVRPRL